MQLTKLEETLKKSNTEPFGVIAFVGFVVWAISVLVAVYLTPPGESQRFAWGFSKVFLWIFGLNMSSKLIIDHFRKKIITKYDKWEYEERMEKQRRDQLEREEREKLQMFKDLVLERVNEKFRIYLKDGTGEINYLVYTGSSFDFPEIKKPMTAFRFVSRGRAESYGIALYPNESLPNLKDVIEHFQLYGQDINGYLNPIPDKIEVLEIFNISRPAIEPPPDLTGLNTIEQLVPILIEAEHNDDQYAINKVLNKMEIIMPKQLH